MDGSGASVPRNTWRINSDKATRSSLKSELQLHPLKWIRTQHRSWISSFATSQVHLIDIELALFGFANCYHLWLGSGAVLHDYHQGLVQYHLPQYAGLQWARIFGVMESAKKQFNIEDYCVGQTTLEQVRTYIARYPCQFVKRCDFLQVFLSFTANQNREREREVLPVPKSNWNHRLKSRFKKITESAL